LRSAVCTRSRHRSLWDLCADGDITGLWATAPDESLAGLRDPNRKTTLLHVALERKLRAPYARLVRWLMSRPGGDDMARCKDIRGETPLHICARWGHASVAVRLARIPGVAVDARDNYEATPLVSAVREEREDVIAALLGARADANAFVANCHGHGDTPLMLAVRLRNAEIVRQILAAPGLDLHQRSLIGVPFGKEALDFAAEGSAIHAMLTGAIGRSQAQREEWKGLEACEAAQGGLEKLSDEPASCNLSGPPQPVDQTRGTPGWSPLVSLAALGRCGCFPCRPP